jgi:hypothetical protein
MEKRRIFLMTIMDKTKISKNKFCPPHYFPHVLPWGKKIMDEPCHFHNAKWRMMHHRLYCKILKCPHYKFMMKKHNLWEEKNKKINKLGS